MRRAINGTIYDTDKGLMLGRLYREDACDAMLMETDVGQYFISSTAAHRRQVASGATKIEWVDHIEPVGTETAKAWLSKEGVIVHHNPFGAEVVPLTAATPAADAIVLRMPPSLKRQIEEAARAEEQSVNAWIRRQTERALGIPSEGLVTVSGQTREG